MVGGHSPSFVAADKIKDSVGFKTPEDGVSMMLNYKASFKADFDLAFEKSAEKQTVLVRVKNNGTLTDTGKLNLFADGVRSDEIHHFELDPGQEKTIQFTLTQNNVRNVTITSKYKSISQNF
jgi:beta-glucosidase